MGEHQRVVIEADGGSRGNPGPAAYGAVLKDADTGEVIAEDASTIGVASNNVAEYSGLIAGLRLAEEFAPDADIEVRMDSKLVVEQMSGRWKIKHASMRPLAMEAPVCHISFYEAAAYAEWKGMRLPTEFEWEAASQNLDWGLRWEWTGSAYLPYPGFTKGPGAVGEYNGKFMINQMVLRGASVATPAGHSRPTYRNFFNPHLRWQFTGIRLAK